MKVKCLWCGEVLESTTVHGMIWCKCGRTGLDYHPVWPRVAYHEKDDSSMYEVIK